MARNPNQYERNVSPLPRSLAAYRFRMDSKTINQHYWVAKLAEGRLSSAIRDSIRQGGPESKPMEWLSLPAIYERRIPTTMSGLSDQMKVHQRWYRLTTLIMLSAALERYINDASRTAILSDPTMSPGFPKKLDGLYLEKHRIRLPIIENSRLTVGEWDSRAAAYKSIFGSVPNAVVDNIGELEKLRKLRNKIAHSMGFDDGFENPERAGMLDLAGMALSKTNPAALDGARLSHDRLVKFMAVSQDVVDGIDRDLMQRFIGSYEVTSMYMEWLGNPDSFERRVGFQSPNNHKKGIFQQSNHVYAKNVFAHTLKFVWNAKYFEQMGSYVDRL